jgi:hypothetical protein
MVEWTIIELDNQNIFLTKQGIIKIKIGIPHKEIKQDIIIKHIFAESSLFKDTPILEFDTDKWYYNSSKQKFYSGIGKDNERYV